MKKSIRAKTISLLMALLLILQLLPLGTAAATEETDDTGLIGQPVENVIIEGELQPESEPEGEPSPEPDVSGEAVPGAESLEEAGEPAEGDAPVSLAASGGTEGVKTNLTGTEYLNIHKTTDANPTRIKITAGGTEIFPNASNEYENVPSGASLEFSLGFSLSDGADPLIYTYDGDEYFNFPLPKGITFAPASGTVNQGGLTIADWEIDPSTQLLTVRFKPVIAGASGIWGYIDMTGTFDRMASGGQDTEIKLGTETIIIKRNPTDPEPPAGAINLDKNGSYDALTNEITWSVTVTPSGSDNIGGYKLVDTYSSNQTYVAGSFEVNSTSVTAGLVEDAGNYKLTYTFPDPTTGSQVITYKTRISTPTIGRTTEFKNTAQLFNKSDASVGSKEKIVPVSNVIKKEGTDIQPDREGRIDWTVTLTLPPASDGNPHVLTNAKIIDHMDKRLELIPGTMMIDFGSGPVSVTVGTAGEEGKYNIVDIGTEDTMTYTFPSDKPVTGTTVTLTYSTKVTDWDAVMTDNASISFTNSAEFEWTPEDGSGGYGPHVSIGTGTITKTASGKGLVKKTLATGWASESQYVSGSEKSGDIIKWKVVVNGNKVILNNAYITDTVQPGHTLLINPTYPLTVTKSGESASKDYIGDENNATYGDLSDIGAGSFKLTFPTPTSATYTIEFYTELTSAARDDMYRGTNKVSENKAFQNNVTLSADGVSESDSATKTYVLKMLEKSVVTAYNVANHTVRWQLVVNRNMLPMAGATVTDVLDAGMEFVIDTEHPMTITALNSAGTTDTHTLNSAGTISAGKPLLDTASLAGATGDGTFTLTLPDPTSAQFTITYWTKVTDTALKGEEASVPWTKKQHTFTNDVTLVTGKSSDVTTDADVTARK